MQTDKNKKIGLTVIVFGTIAFFISIFYFNQSGTVIEYKNLSYMLKMFVSYGILVITLYWGLYFTHSKKLATQVGGSATLLLILGYILGFIIH